MAITPKALYRGAATTTTSTTLYTVPSATTTIVTNVVVTNTGADDHTFTLSLDGVALAQEASIPSNSVASFDIKQVLSATDTISGGATATAVNFHISGVEVV